jgi:hypothetical protein
MKLYQSFSGFVLMEIKIFYFILFYFELTGYEMGCINGFVYTQLYEACIVYTH